VRKRTALSSEFTFPKMDGLGMAKATPCGVVQQAVKDANAAAELLGRGADHWGAPSIYGSHSMRRGGVTEARRSGVDMLDIQLHGRWTSAAVYGYVGPSMECKAGVTRNLFGSGGPGAAFAPARPAAFSPSPSRKVRLADRGLANAIAEAVGKAAAAAGGLGGATGKTPVKASKTSPLKTAAVGSTTVKAASASVRATASTPVQVSTIKRKHHDSDDEKPSAQEQEDERVLDLLQVEADEQGYSSEVESDSASTTGLRPTCTAPRRGTKPSGGSKRPRVAEGGRGHGAEASPAQPTVVTTTATGGTAHRYGRAKRASSKDAEEKMKGQK
jgi:hypothetical protein